MSSPFSRTMRSLERRSFRGSRLTWVMAAVLAGAWLLWFFLATISVYEASPLARLESLQTPPRIEAPLAGRIVAVDMALGQEVAAGQLLAELDSESSRRALLAEEAQGRALTTQLAALRRQLAAARRATGELGTADRVALEAAAVLQAGAESHARFTADEMRRIEQAHAAGQITEVARRRLETEVLKASAAAEAQRQERGRLRSEHRVEEGRRQAELDQLVREIGEVEGHLATNSAACERLRYDVALHRIRAPIAGTVAELAALRPGTVVHRGARLATIVPPAQLRVVADYLPAAAMGRIRSGQRARLRLDGFPWVRYGCLAARVTEVASEVRRGCIRVELVPDTVSPPPVPLRHGLTGTVEIEVEQVPPASLVLRALARLLTVSPAAATG